MQLTHDPWPFIFSHGDAATQLSVLAFMGLEDSPRAKACLLELVKRQRSDGAQPSELDRSAGGCARRSERPS